MGDKIATGFALLITFCIAACIAVFFLVVLGSVFVWSLDPLFRDDKDPDCEAGYVIVHQDFGIFTSEFADGYEMTPLDRIQFCQE